MHKQSVFACALLVIHRSFLADCLELQVFCSAWDRANHTYCPQPPPPPAPAVHKDKPGVFALAEQRAQSSTVGWGCGACSDAARGVGDGCYVGAWSTPDLK